MDKKTAMDVIALKSFTTSDPMHRHTKLIRSASVEKLINDIYEDKKEQIPGFAADWINYTRDNGCSISSLMNYDNIVDYSHDLTLWCFESGSNDNLHKLASAWLNGFEIEKEPKYKVQVDGLDGWYFYKDENGDLAGIEKYATVPYSENNSFLFTPSEIKKLRLENHYPFLVKL